MNLRVFYLTRRGISDGYALAHDFVGFLAVFGRHNIRPPHFASKVSYSASPQAFAA